VTAGRAVVCGTRFGRTYMSALACGETGWELAAILARGSARSRRCADAFGVPLVTDPDDLPGDIDLACVVVGGELNGGPGAELARGLLARGLHVVQEHPLSERELAGCLREARSHSRYYRLNTHYPDVAPVRTLLEAARALFAAQPARHVDVTCSIVVLGPTLEIVATALGRPRPYRFSAAERCGPYTSVAGEIAGVPVALRVQNEIHPANRDSFAHTLHRVTLVADGGSLHLAGAHGPVLWMPRMHMPAEIDGAAALDASGAGQLDLPGARVLYGSPAPTTRELVAELWPAATARVLRAARAAIDRGDDGLAAGQQQLALARMTADLSAILGRPRLLDDEEPEIIRADAIVTAATAAATAGPQPTKEPMHVA
jgi:pyochelin biosynthetic protein PchG